MARLSEHFRDEDFRCRCNFCKGQEFRIHLGLVGVLEMIGEHFKKKVSVLSAYWCDEHYESLNRNSRSYHTMGKAAHIKIEGIELNELFKYVETIEGLNGLGFYPKEGFVHIDTRPSEKKESWIKEGESYTSITAEKRRQYGL
ncbi:hypothetical protein A2526_01495 [candidate division WOR-1 bacterium RIFOXYD2_FULL_36_8]|uniref:Peptidase M15A C-terminal domain-containing protein n=1 Tax=candidate division WOR-1 bacterium RIFOXYB2_FULL_36_35 TaxID=1802578 RepID=A0A1F4S1K4_UNCSA|nr:MAG: hypothetical protein A2230_05220 [candidate division WOR-1 bacterium RIFOXYA2_FULL_36_21]OGC14326.1 MAG: hypothetical protein A2290_08300 [candidate division WOR-1 bacterium RIFOXYB2_FULL_36_35]OGC19642.1 MAG: hypothetical protein A2282_02785 [candidate division WOR-1 bacterium RIFOXYA12_FULL_36_13]OGC40678.1 MAG: hypothetical protein A2526_01495 [candidate division WOR-1 bacterium RIFOXYD2_FULL_36_8]